MSYSLCYERAAWHSLMKLPESLQRRMFAALEALEQQPRPSGVTKLTGYENLYRIRVGDYRAIYSIEDDLLRLIVLKVGSRGNVYRP